MTGRRNLKRSGAPRFWRIPRKSHKFTVLASPGPHPRDESYPLAVFVRDILKLVQTYREAEAAIHGEGFLVDGVIRRRPDFPIGLMDIFEVPAIDGLFRVVPVSGSPLAPVPIPKSERSLKLCKIRSKVMVRGGRIQLGFHDGRNLLVDDHKDLKCSDVCLLEVPSQKILDTLKFGKGALVLVAKGERAGLLGKVVDVKAGTFSRPRMADVSFEDVTTELPTDILFQVGREKPLVTVTRGAGE